MGQAQAQTLSLEPAPKPIPSLNSVHHNNLLWRTHTQTPDQEVNYFQVPQCKIQDSRSPTSLCQVRILIRFSHFAAGNEEAVPARPSKRAPNSVTSSFGRDPSSSSPPPSLASPTSSTDELSEMEPFEPRAMSRFTTYNNSTSLNKAATLPNLQYQNQRDRIGIDHDSDSAGTLIFYSFYKEGGVPHAKRMSLAPSVTQYEQLIFEDDLQVCCHRVELFNYLREESI